MRAFRLQQILEHEIWYSDNSDSDIAPIKSFFSSRVGRKALQRPSSVLFCFLWKILDLCLRRHIDNLI